MIDLNLDQNKIQEIRYTLKDGKSAIFKLCDSVLEDVEIIKGEKECCNKSCTCKTYVVDEETEKENKCDKFSLEHLDKYGPKKHLDDYEPFSCLKSEKGMQEALDASRKKEWKEDVMTRPSKPTETGNALVPVDYTSQNLKKEENKE